MMKQSYENKMLPGEIKPDEVIEALVNDGTPIFKQESPDILVIDVDPPEVDKEESKLFFDVEIKTTK